ncbi:hypothetical protein [Chitinophaga rhizosphaerae]|uniref:hypothetical protein n=1 Tax=Chitinophaga rhizosphaerae TaxID=1864947 RepID=UPI000F80060F|nr:hypothetical protein [Chitinophaga rhizosphaerae]
MKASAFVTAVRNTSIESGIQQYKDMLSNEIIATDPLWMAVRKLYDTLSAADRDTFLLFIRQVQVDTLSHVFGVLDGSTYLNEKREVFQLTSASDGAVLNGDLQDLLLAMEE